MVGDMNKYTQMAAADSMGKGGGGGAGIYRLIKAACRSCRKTYCP